MPEHNSIKIHKVLEFEDIKWLRVLQAMQDQFGIKFFEANTHLQIFWKHFREPLNLHWKKSEKLSSIENKIILALCECYSADKIEICFRRECALGSKSLGYEQRTEFSPEFDRASQSSGCQKNNV